MSVIRPYTPEEEAEQKALGSHVTVAQGSEGGTVMIGGSIGAVIGGGGGGGFPTPWPAIHKIARST